MMLTSAWPWCGASVEPPSPACRIAFPDRPVQHAEKTVLDRIVLRAKAGIVRDADFNSDAND